MSHVDPGPLASYNSLSDPNLTAYFSNSRMRKHLLKTGLVTRRGEIVSEKVFRLNNARKEHQRHVRDLLAQAIVHKALDMERHRQMEIKRQLEEIGKVERVRRVRADRALRGDEDILPLLSAPLGKQPTNQERPHTAPAGRSPSKPSNPQIVKRQLPQSVGYPAIPGDSPYNTRSTRIKTPYPNVEIDNQHLNQLDQEALRTFTINLPNYDLGSGVSPYVVPVLDPASREVLETMKPTQKRRRKFKNRPATAPVQTSKKEKEISLSARSNKHSLELHRREPPMIYKKQPRSLSLITFKYLGQIVNLDRETEDPRDEIVVDQQHCGGGNLSVYRGKLLPGNNFTIISQRHRGYPFSLTFYLNGMIVERLSTCCEYKHKRGFKVGGKTSHFGLIKVEGAHPCYKCLVASEKFRTTSDQSALAKITFEKRDSTEEQLSPKQALEKISNEPKYEDSFASSGSESSQPEESLSSLTPVEDEKISSASESSSAQRKSGKSSSRSTSKSSSPLASMPSSSISALSDSTIEDKKRSSPKPKLDIEKRFKKKSSSGTNSSVSNYSDIDDEGVVHPDPTPLRGKIRAVRRQAEKIDLSHFALNDEQVDELCEMLTDDSMLITTLALYNCNLSSEKLGEILETVAGSCRKIRSVNIGKNKGIPVEELRQLLEKTLLDTLILDDNYVSSQNLKTIVKVLEPSNNKTTSTKPSTSDNSFNKMHLIPVARSVSSEDSDGGLQILSLNRTRMDKDGIKVIADFLMTNPTLSELYLNGNFLTGDSLEPMWKALSSRKNTNLIALHLSSNRLNDQGLKNFADKMVLFSVLEKLVLTKNNITDAGAVHLLRFVEANTTIKELFVALGNTIKRKMLKEIKQALNDNRSD